MPIFYRIKTIKKQGLLLILSGLVIAAFIVEAGLRIAGFIYMNYRISDIKKGSLAAKNVIKILCVGDSMTFGDGADRGFSYPDQLEKLLNKNSDPKFVVYNCGMLGANSSQLLKNLPGQLLKYKADIVIVMTGINDHWNLEDSNYYSFIHNKQSSPIYRLDGFLMKFKSYKLLKLISMNLRSKISRDTKIAAELLKAPERPSTPKPDIEAKVESELNRAESYWNAFNRDYESAISILKGALDLDPCNKKILSMLGEIYSRAGPENFNLTVETYRKIIEIDPTDINAHRFFFDLYRRQGKVGLAKQEAETIVCLDPGNLTFRRILATGIPCLDEEEQYKRLIIANIEKIAELVRLKNKIIILQNYPNPHYDNFYNSAIQEAAVQYNIPFVDNKAQFEKLASLAEYSTQDYFISDGHCNAKGYRVIAENVYNLLTAELK